MTEMSTDEGNKDPSSNADLTQIVIGAAMKVLNTLRPGLDEKLYERALVIDLTKQGIRCDQQKEHEVRYDGQLIGTLIPDLTVEDCIIVEQVATGWTQRESAYLTYIVRRF